MTTTIRDVAKRAGVGLGTVSRVINDSPQVSEATRERVQTAIAALNFVPNPTARRLSLGKTLTIAVIVPWFTRPAEVERLRGVENTLAESDYDLVLYNVETPEKRDAYFRDVTRSERADGVLIISLSPRDDDVERLARSTVPIVLVDANHPSLKSLNRVITDDQPAYFITYRTRRFPVQTVHIVFDFLGDIPVALAIDQNVEHCLYPDNLAGRRNERRVAEILSYPRDFCQYIIHPVESVLLLELGDKVGYHATGQLVEEHIAVNTF